MSAPPSSPPEAEAPPPQQERLPVRTVLLAGAGAILLFAAAVLATWALMERWRGPSPAPHQAPFPPQLGQAEINIVNQVYLPTVDQGRREQAAARKVLSSYGWVDRERGLIHIPVEQAMEALAAPPGGPR